MEESYRGWIMEELDSWSQTFNNSHSNSTDEEIVNWENASYEYIQSLIQKFSDNNCSENDYENILFHLWQQKAEH